MKKLLLSAMAVCMAAAAFAANPTLYLRGDWTNDNWGATTKCQMTETDGVYTIDVANLSGNFKIADNKWGNQWSTQNTTMALGTEYTCSSWDNIGNMALKEAAKDVTVTFDINTKKLKITGTEDTDVKIGYELYGTLGTSASWTAKAFTEGADGWSVSHTFGLPTGKVLVRKTINGTATDYYKAATAATKLTPGSSVTLATSNTADMSYALTTGTEYTLSFNPQTGVLTCSCSGEAPEPVVPEKFYLSGDLTDDGWAFNAPATRDGNKFSGSFEVTKATGYITFTTGEMTNWTVTGGLRYGAGDADVEVVADTPYDMTAGSDKCWTIAEGKYKYVADFSAITPTVTFSADGDTPEPPVPPVPAAPELYLRGAISGTTWPAVDEYKFTEANGVYTLSIPKLSGNFKISTDEWDNDYTYSTNNTAMALGQEYTVSTGEATTDMGLATPAKNVTITLDTNTSKLKIVGEEDVVVISYSINSSLTDELWSVADMTQNESVWTYTVTPTVAEGEMIVVMNENGVAKAWYKAADDAPVLTAGTSAVLTTTNADNLKYSLTAGTEYTFTFDPATGELSVDGNATPVPTAPELYLRGAISGTSWPAVDDFKFTENAGVYTLSIPTLSGQFKISTADWDDTYTYSTNNTAMVLGEEYDVVSGLAAGNMSLATAAKNVTITFDSNTSKLKIVGEEDQVVVSYTISSSLTDELWSEADMTYGEFEGNKTWYYTVTPLISEGEMLVIKKENGVACDWYKATATDLLEAGTSVILSSANNANLKYKLTLETEYTFTFDSESGKLAVTQGLSGIDAIAADAENAPVYYNLQGVRVNTPAPGMYIVIRDGKATKEYVK